MYETVTNRNSIVFKLDDEPLVVIKQDLDGNFHVSATKGVVLPGFQLIHLLNWLKETFNEQ